MQVAISLTDDDIEAIAARLLDRIVSFLPKPSTTADEVLNKRELASYLRVSESTVSDWVSSGSIPFIKLSPGQSGAVRFSKKAIDKWLLSKSVPC